MSTDTITGLYTEVETITPHTAKMLLDTNIDNNRQLNMANVRFLANQMKKGKWEQDGMPIRVGTTGKLLDGQHRLRAIIESGTTQQMLMVYNIDESTFTVMDTGRVRTASDTLHIAGIKNSKAAAATAKLILSYERYREASALKMNSRPQKAPVTNQEVLEFNQAVDLAPYLKLATKWAKVHPIFATAEYALFYWIFSHISEEDAMSFLEGVSSGANLALDSPIYGLRTKLTTYKINKVSMSANDRLGMTFKAWNQFRNRLTVKQLLFDIEKEGIPEPI